MKSKGKKLGKNEYWTPNSLLSNETPSSPFFCDMFPKHIERMRENKRREKTIGETIETYKDVIELLGNKPIGDYTNIDGRYYRNSLLKTPKNRKRVKRYRDKNIHELMSLDFPPSDKMSFENQSKLISRMTSCWNYFEEIKKNLIDIESNHGKIDIFINNAGIAGMNTTVAEYPLEEWNKVIDLNLNAVFYCCKAVVPFMLKNNYGRIVNIASIAGKEGNPNASAYSSSKAGVIGLTKSLGKELALKNIAVNCVTPAAAKTRIFDQMTQEHIDYMLSKIPRNRFAKVNELASLVTWLASEENSFSTSAVFDLSGGRATY